MCTSIEEQLPLVHMAVPTSFLRSLAPYSAGNALTCRCWDPAQVHTSPLLPSRTQCSNRTLHVCQSGAWQAAPQDTLDSALPLGLHPALAVVPLSWCLFPSTTCPLSLSRSCTCEFTCDFWLSNATDSCQSLIIAVTSFFVCFSISFNRL